MKKIKIFSLIFCLLVLLCLTGCGHSSLKDDSKNYNISINKIDGVDVKTYISSGQDQLIVSVTNKSGKIIGSGNISVSYYDENDKKIIIYGTDDVRYNMFENDSELVYGFELPTKNNSSYYIPTKTEVKITVDEEYQEKYSHIIEKYAENFIYSYTKTDKAVTLILKNNGSNAETAPRDISVVFYKNNKPIYSEDVNFIFNKVNSGETIKKEFNIPTDYKKSKENDQDILIDFDDIKIFRIVEGIS